MWNNGQREEEEMDASTVQIWLPPWNTGQILWKSQEECFYHQQGKKNPQFFAKAHQHMQVQPF